MCEEKKINEMKEMQNNNSQNLNEIKENEEMNQNGLFEENKQLKEKIAELENQLKEIQNAARIIKATFENYKLDVDRQLKDASKSTALRIIKALIPILDDFKRAFKYYESDNDLEKFKLGVEKIYEKLLKTLENEGLRVIDATGKFDPFNHEAFEKEERDDVEEYTILEVIEDGYTFNGQVVKPTKVRVAVKPRKKAKTSENMTENKQENEQ
ncbi:nucleotide exchange factor GrpE [Fervidobacterium islandicum]|uniref:Protein GrpE n=1 Tax=Fervidobacterium islandicum TaxID=2423 RepID=A0AAI8GDM4_FERIS|nr:nucleotide exchange factor GrpE [Fervidobacterium islandicum]AMW33424.1 nucleotide exchange factor GrpE [Fervidobacterium islandicum]